jgi:hypothetical protein
MTEASNKLVVRRRKICSAMLQTNRNKQTSIVISSGRIKETIRTRVQQSFQRQCRLSITSRRGHVGPATWTGPGPIKHGRPSQVRHTTLHRFSSSSSTSLLLQLVIATIFSLSSSLLLLRNRVHGASGFGVGVRLLGLPPAVNAG